MPFPVWLCEDAGYELYKAPVNSFSMSADHAAGFSIQAVGRVRSPYREKFGIPRQPGLVNVPATIEMLPPFHEPEMFEGLADFSHLWLSFIFHACLDQGWKKKVRPPRLGGNVSKGVFATRSPFRPNHLGLSVVQLDRIETVDGRVVLHVLGADLLDGTPIVDIKPYVSYTDTVAGASSGFAGKAPGAVLDVAFSAQAGEVLKLLPDGKLLADQLAALISLDPRPAYKQGDTDARTWGMRFSTLDVRWRVEGRQALVTGIDVLLEDETNQ
ncbi:tRNA (N6-threonylcarbamoyladenosine(37)-N6)-methyltransferase TrmO [Thiolapillus sp.]